MYHYDPVEERIKARKRMEAKWAAEARARQEARDRPLLDAIQKAADEARAKMRRR